MRIDCAKVLHGIALILHAGSILPGPGIIAAPEAAALKGGELLSRYGTSYESAARLARKAAEAEARIGIHGVSCSAKSTQGAASTAARTAVEAHFPVHSTPSLADPPHRTIELPKPITKTVADLFNEIFGRSR